MPLITKQEAFQRFRTDARNSSHFVWFLDDLQFFLTTDDSWIFGFRRVGQITLIALEPLMPAPAETSSTARTEQAFDRAWEEFCNAVQPKIAAFVAVYDSFQNILAKKGFQSLKIGQEPWVDLNDCVPKGNSGKGVRAARNQALNAGATIEEWLPADILKDASKRETLLTLFAGWKNKRLVNLSGFLNATDPLAYCEDRRYFVARSQAGEVEGYLVASPVAGVQGYFLEDMVFKPGATRGSGELLTLEALLRLGSSGALSASLGVVSVTSIDAKCAHGLPGSVSLWLIELPKILQKLYNFNGLETFRKRFKPKEWKNIHLAVQNRSGGATSDLKAWLSTLFAMLVAFRPRLTLNVGYFKNLITATARKHPVSWMTFLVSLGVFGLVNHFGTLPQSVLDHWGFSGNAPISQWYYRTVTSDFLYFDPVHFWIWGCLYVVVLRWAEKSHSLRFVALSFLAVTFFDDFLNYFLIIRPFSILKPELYQKLVAFKDVGGSLGLVAFVGLQICQFRRNREIIFAGLVLSLVFGYVFKSLNFSLLVLNLNHFLFLTLGYVVGKLKFEMECRAHERASKNRAPVPVRANTDQPSHQKQSRTPKAA